MAEIILRLNEAEAKELQSTLRDELDDPLRQRNISLLESISAKLKKAEYLKCADQLWPFEKKS